MSSVLRIVRGFPPCTLFLAVLVSACLVRPGTAVADTPPEDAEELTTTAGSLDQSEDALRSRIAILLERVRAARSNGNQGGGDSGGRKRIDPGSRIPIDPNILIPIDSPINGRPDPGNIDPVRTRPGDLTKVDPVTSPSDRRNTGPVTTRPGDLVQTNPTIAIPKDTRKSSPGVTPPTLTPPTPTPPTGRVPTPTPPSAPKRTATSPTPPRRPAPTTLSFAKAGLAASEYGYSAGKWRVERHPRLVGDVNGDGRTDIVGFGNDGTYLTLASAPSRNRRAGAKGTAPSGSFQTTRKALASYSYSGGWRVEKHVRLLGDVNGDGKEDLVAFHDKDIFLSLSTGSGFGKPKKIGTGLGYASGWRVNEHPRHLADVNGDGKDDIVGFGAGGTYLALSRGTSFDRPSIVLPQFGAKQGWKAADHERVLADVDGDGKADIVGFGQDGTWVAISRGSKFSKPVLAVKSFGHAQGWRSASHARLVGDVNGDGKADLVGCGNRETSVYLSRGRGFAKSERLAFFHSKAGWTAAKHPRVLEDVNGDGKMDLVGFGGSRTFVALSHGSGFDAATEIFEDFSYAKGWRVQRHPRFVADFDGDGKADILGFGNGGTYLAPAK